jgi:hypothetical protein
VGGHVREPQWRRIPDQLPEHTASARQRSDPPAGGLVEPDEQEALELLARGIDDPECRVLRPRELARGVEHLPQHDLDVELGNKRATNLQEAAELPLGEALRPQRGS